MVYFDLNEIDGNIEDIIGTNVYQVVIKGISFGGDMGFELVTLLEHFGTIFEIRFISY